jgi:hypothetical protein
VLSIPDSVADGGAPGAPVALATGHSAPEPLVADDRGRFWIEGRAVIECALAADGMSCLGVPRTIADGQDQPKEIAVDGDAVYWTNFGTSASNGTVNRAPR